MIDNKDKLIIWIEKFFIQKACWKYRFRAFPYNYPCRCLKCKKENI